MRKTREVLRLHFDLKLKQRQIARSANLSQSTVHEYLARFAAAGLIWPLPAEMSERDLEAALFPIDRRPQPPLATRTLPDFTHVHEELRSHKHTTLQLLWEEYRANHPDGYGYSRFCHHYQQWKRQRDVVMRQEHRPGQKLFVDWAGDKIALHDPHRGGVQTSFLRNSRPITEHRVLDMSATFPASLRSDHTWPRYTRTLARGCSFQNS